jgi:(S)-ureidoglycine aminohydrolase
MPNHPLGQTRTQVHHNHAFIAPDTHVQAPFAGWTNTLATILISPQMMNRPKFMQYLADMSADASAGQPLPNVQRLIYVLQGTAQVTLEEQSLLTMGSYAYIPSNTPHNIHTITGCQLLVFEKPYIPSPLTDERPTPIIGNAWERASTAFMNDEGAQLRLLLPDTLAYDMAINIFHFESGFALPLVECHVMEHGLYFLQYRLDQNWYPIQTGDAIWMGAYCPQWFCAFGKTPSAYIYYKDINRDPLD